MRLWRQAGVLAAGCVTAAAAPFAQGGEPLTLDAALRSAGAAHPEVRAARADLEIARAARQMTAAGDQRAADLEVRAADARLRAAIDDRRVDIAGRFFDVLRADTQYSVESAFMSVAYVRFTTARDQAPAGRPSAADLAELERAYRDLLVKREAAVTRQRLARATLADAMNLPGKLPGDVQAPELSGTRYALPGLEALSAMMLERNAQLASRRALLQAAEARLDSARGEAGRSAPVNGRVEHAQAVLHRQEAELADSNAKLQHALLDSYLEAGFLQGTLLPAAQRSVADADQALERGRAALEAGTESSLGPLMAGALRARSEQADIEYRLALAIARLGNLVGGPLDGFAARAEQ